MASIDDYDLNTKTEFSRRALCPKDDKFCEDVQCKCCLLYTSPSPRDRSLSRMPSSA